MKWIRLKKYCDNTGETRNTVMQKRLKWWTEGIHWKYAPKPSIWINTEKADEWVENCSNQ